MCPMREGVIVALFETLAVIKKHASNPEKASLIIIVEHETTLTDGRLTQNVTSALIPEL